MHEEVVVNTSCLIALATINRLEVLCTLYEQVLLPPAVLGEFGKLELKCARTEKVNSPLVRFLHSEMNLGKGESEVIALAAEKKLPAVIDDARARNIGRELGVKITGTIGVLLRCEGEGVIRSAYREIVKLRRKGFFVSERILKDVREGKF